MSERKHVVAKRVAVALAVLLAVAVVAMAWYVNDYYRADEVALAAAADANGDADGVSVREVAPKALAFVPAQPTTGLVFYPGAKVQPEAYAPLMQRLAQHGILCVLIRPTFNLAILDANAADGIQAQFPEVRRWGIAGHSMGGVAAADFASRHGQDFSAVAFLASYPSTDLTGFAGSALTIVGTSDGVLNRDRCAEAKKDLPAAASERDIEGGNHAYFGNYGEQAGDGQATISRDDQQEQTAEAIASMLTAA